MNATPHIFEIYSIFNTILVSGCVLNSLSGTSTIINCNGISLHIYKLVWMRPAGGNAYDHLEKHTLLMTRLCNDIVTYE